MGAHVYIVGIGETVFMNLIEQDVVSVSICVETAFLIRVTLDGGSKRQAQIALPFCSHS